MQYNNAQGRFSTDIKKNAYLLRVLFLFFLFPICGSERNNLKKKNKTKKHIVHNKIQPLRGKRVFVFFYYILGIYQGRFRYIYYLPIDLGYPDVVFIDIIEWRTTMRTIVDL